MKTRGRPHVAALLASFESSDVRAELRGLDAVERFEFLDAVAKAFKSEAGQRQWRPKELWRSKNKDESAREFLERVYLSAPYDDRPYTHELGDATTGDRPLYLATMMLVSNNRRLGRDGPKGSVNAARSLDDLFPMVGSGAGSKRRDLPEAFEALLYVAEMRASAAQRSAEARAALKAAAGRVSAKDIAAQKTALKPLTSMPTRSPRGAKKRAAKGGAPTRMK